ncbi:type II toxin-antitoxin system RelE/ParE family toxin [Telmatospirillum sp. J64-1]|uniref:type II toxin-antitoxin system RelE/ParE family toxin n=1 Tax=Telmatospirillum sp. J64-1 TaxID=2502183 RepID=UPI00115C57CE|nr:type II toxin-antitoxin system RelE/ParE family toxin [Telmatospirillum sp. J64-1]
MDVEFADDSLDRLEVDAHFTGGFAQNIVRGYRKALQAIRAATDERDLLAARGLRYEKLLGQRAGQNSMRINNQWRLIVEIVGDKNNKKIRVLAIEDYH